MSTAHCSFGVLPALHALLRTRTKIFDITLLCLRVCAHVECSVYGRQEHNSQEDEVNDVCWTAAMTSVHLQLPHTQGTENKFPPTISCNQPKEQIVGGDKANSKIQRSYYKIGICAYEIVT
jgi:hypothetical protein